MNDHWLCPKGQEELRRMSEEQSKRGINIFDFAPATKSSLSPMTAPEDECYEVELTADTRARDKAVPKLMCTGNSITPSVQPLSGMEYEVVTGESIPNLGEKRCEMWTEEASAPKSISMQVADVLEARRSFSRCADMGLSPCLALHLGV